MKNWLTNNFLIKVVSLILAIITWFYVNDELNKEKFILRRSFYESSFMERLQKQISRDTSTGHFNEETKGNKGYILEK